jgi:lipopolysaccharide transport system ATP-binding protein
MSTILRVAGLGKQYRIGMRTAAYTTAREAVLEMVRTSFLRLRRRPRPAETALWALRDVDFAVSAGEVLGIIGRNGAGKSTLLKVLSRITEPTTGRVELYGRVGSLLEVGTGFHPELTGRENIWLNGAILGMKRAEISRKFDEIVAFAGIEPFLDTPVKRYSSGMYVRLAFAVAAHLEPEILIVDEVLAVGDAAFQRKCLGKMEDVARHGRTVLLVSHNMAAVRGLCGRALWLDEGQLRSEGDPATVVAAYLAAATEGFSPGPAGDDEALVVERVVLLNNHGERTLDFTPGDDLVVEIHYEARRPIPAPYFWVSISSQYGPLFAANMLLDGRRPRSVEGRGVLSCVFESLPLLPQLYTVQLGARAADGVTFLVASREVAFFNVVGKMADVGYTGELADVLSSNATPMSLPYRWRFPDGEEVRIRMAPTGEC